MKKVGRATNVWFCVVRNTFHAIPLCDLDSHRMAIGSETADGLPRPTEAVDVRGADESD